MNRILILSLLFLAFAIPAGAQRIEPSVIGSAGELFLATNSQLQMTLGETVTATFLSGNGRITQGFHQPNLSITAISAGHGPAFPLTFWPNPTSDWLNVRIPDTGPAAYQLMICDMRGKILHRRQASEGETFQIDLSVYTAGHYILRARNLTDSSIQNFKIIKY